MTRAGMKAALEHGKRLQAFASVEAAERELFRRRDELLDLLAELARRDTVFMADYSPESLKSLERWYFLIWECGGFDTLSIGRELFEQCMAMYYGEVAVRNISSVEWIVADFPFTPGKYQIGISNGNGAVMRSRFTDLYRQPNNKGRQSIWREYRQFAK
jgi:hypothetical protein